MTDWPGAPKPERTMPTGQRVASAAVPVHPGTELQQLGEDASEQQQPHPSRTPQRSCSGVNASRGPGGTLHAPTGGLVSEEATGRDGGGAGLAASWVATSLPHDQGVPGNHVGSSGFHSHLAVARQPSASTRGRGTRRPSGKVTFRTAQQRQAPRARRVSGAIGEAVTSLAL